MLRRLFFVLLCLGLALQGQLVHASVPPPCPMEAEMIAASSAADAAPADELPDCCNDMPTFAATGQTCKAGNDCGATPLVGFLPAPGPVPAAPAAAAPATFFEPIRSAPVAPPWRPPAAR